MKPWTAAILGAVVGGVAGPLTSKLLFAGRKDAQGHNVLPPSIQAWPSPTQAECNARGDLLCGLDEDLQNYFFTWSFLPAMAGIVVGYAVASRR